MQRDATAKSLAPTLMAHQTFRKILELGPVGAGRQRGYKFRGNVSLEKLIAGETMNKVPAGQIRGSRMSFRSHAERQSDPLGADIG